MDIMIPQQAIPGSEIHWMPGSPLQNAAILLASGGHRVEMVSEVARDAVGEMLCNNLKTSGVGTKSIDRVSDGAQTSSALFFTPGNNVAPVIYHRSPEERFDAVWPRIDPGDVVMFGSAELLQPRAHQFMTDLLDHIADRHAISIYAPLISPAEVPRITRATPVILEYLERAHITLLRPEDTMMLFTTTDSAKCYSDHVRFYCRTMLYCDAENHTVNIYHNKLQASARFNALHPTLMWQAGALASLSTALDSTAVEINTDNTLVFSQEQLSAIATMTADGADAAADTAIIDH